MSNTEKTQRKLKNAYGNGRESKVWRNDETTWNEMCEKLSRANDAKIEIDMLRSLR